MDSQDSGIEEKLVPFVEGALAEADRREVLQALPNNATLFQEVKQLREAIQVLRTQAAHGLTYHTTTEMPGDQVVDYVQQGESLSRAARRQFELQLLESSDLSDEVAILRELDQDLQQRVEASRPVPEMPAALKAAIQETYGRRAPEAAWKRPAAALVAWIAGLNFKVAGAAVAGLTIVIAGASIGRYAHTSLQRTNAGELASAPAAPANSTQSTTKTTTVTASAPAGQVALSPDKIHPEELPRLSRLLWQKQVSHSYRDGQIYVASADVDRAWAALNMNEGKMVASRPLKTRPIPQTKEEEGPGLVGGIIGALPLGKDAADKKKRDVFASSGGAAATPAPSAGPQSAPVRPAATAAPQVAIALPDAPENDPVFQADAAPPPPPVSSAPAPVASAPRNANGGARRETSASYKAPARTTYTAPPRTRQDNPYRHAPPAVQDLARPSQMARQVPPPPPPPAPAEPRDRQAANVAPSPEQRRKAAEEVVAPAVQPLNKPRNTGNDGLAQSAAEPPRAAEPVPASAPPVPVSVAVEPGRGPQGSADESATSSAFRRSEDAPGGMRPVPKLQTRDLPGAGAQNRSTVALGTNNDVMAKVGTENFEVPANAPFEVAMLPVARKLVQEAIGEAKVQMERREDGTLLLTIRPARSLSAEEIDKLRKLVREKLDLKIDDTVVIRQP